MQKIEKRYPNGNLKLVQYLVDDKKHNPTPNKPAVTEYYESGAIMNTQDWMNDRKHGICRYYYPDGKVECETYWRNNSLHRVDGPASITFYPSGKIRSESYWLNDMFSNKNAYREFDIKGSVTKEFNLNFL